MKTTGDQFPTTPPARGDERVLCAFALGYYHGRAVGVEENPYSGETQPHEHAAYTDGYERGVGDYCDEHGEED